MRKIIYALLLLIAFSACGTKDESGNQISAVQGNDALDMMIGAVKLNDFEKSPYAEWYNSEKAAYTIDQETMNSFSLKGYKVLLVFGSWCGDSRREVPRFMKLMEYKGFSDVEFCAVDRSKICEGKNAEELNIQRVPTFIFFKDGIEAGRIIESPALSLEKDMMAIVTKE